MHDWAWDISLLVTGMSEQARGEFLRELRLRKREAGRDEGLQRDFPERHANLARLGEALARRSAAEAQLSATLAKATITLESGGSADR